MDWPKMYRTSSSFLALPVTKVTGRERINPDAEAPAAAIFPRFLEMVGVEKTRVYREALSVL